MRSIVLIIPLLVGVSYSAAVAESHFFEETRARAEKGDAQAQYDLGQMYYDGHDVPRDYAEAITWFRKGAEQGYTMAQFMLGVMYDRGHGVPQDDVTAYMWVSLAAAQHSSDRATLDEIEKRLTPEQIAEAQRLAREWLAARQ